MTALKFKSVMKIYKSNPYIHITKEQASFLKSEWKKPMPVIIRINNEPKKGWKINMMPRGNGNFYLYLHGYVRKASKTKVGDLVKVEITFDDTYRNGPMHPMPLKFSTALDKSPKAKTKWNALIPSRKKEILRYFSQLKSSEAKERNVTKAINALEGKGERFMARDW